MSLPKTGSRKITVEGVEYRWLIRKKPTYGQALNESNLSAAIELYESPRSTLVVTFPFMRPDSWISPSKESVKPSDIKDSITLAIQEGWSPHSNSATFHLQRT